MLDQATLPGLNNATFSLESESGATHCVAPDGLMTDPSGQVHAPANLSARQAREKGLLTSGTFGPRSSISSVSAALSRSLASRLQAVTALYDSTLYVLTWKEQVTPAGRVIPLLRASAHRTSGPDCTGWPTPATRDGKGGYAGGRMRNGKLSTDVLDVTAQLTEPKRLTVSGELLIGLDARITSCGQLNPALSRWLLGLPPEWDDCAVMAMPLSPRKPKRL